MYLRVDLSGHGVEVDVSNFRLGAGIGAVVDIRFSGHGLDLGVGLGKHGIASIISSCC